MKSDLKGLFLATGGEIVGRIRLQKMVYLLDQLGMNSGYSFDYHHYGPYSSDLASDVDIEAAFGSLKEDTRRRMSDGVPYSVFSYPGQSDVGDRVGDLAMNAVREACNKMGQYSATVLELAATINWLSKFEKLEDWRKELIVRKSSKASESRIEEAMELLRNLGLPPATK